MRCTHIIGLPPDATDFISENISLVPDVVCPNCGKVCTKRWGHHTWLDRSDVGMFDDGPELQEYMLKDGRVVREHIQAAPWSSGPCIFLKLIDEDMNILFEWSEDDMEKML